MLRRANQTSFKPGIDPRTGGPAMTNEELKARKREYYEKHKPKLLRRNWEKQIRRCGWTPEEYHDALVKQGGVCFICLGKGKKRLAADHCHKTGKRRHLLCTRCNAVLGLVGENPDLIRRMERYCAKQ